MVLFPAGSVSAYVGFLGIIFFDLEFQTVFLFFPGLFDFILVSFFSLMFHPSRCSIEFCLFPQGSTF